MKTECKKIKKKKAYALEENKVMTKYKKAKSEWDKIVIMQEILLQ